MITKTKGDCECCIDSIDVELFHADGMLMCAKCHTDHVEAKNKAAVKIIEDSRRIDSSIGLKQDVFNNMTVSFIELQAAIEANAEIPEERKQYALMEECAARIDILNKAIFEEEKSLLEKRNERQALTVNAQNVIARIRQTANETQRKELEKFKQFDVNYKPQAPTKREKTVKPVKAAKTFNKKELFDAAAKYKVPAAQVQSIIVAQDKSPEDAAKYLAGLMGLL